MLKFPKGLCLNIDFRHTKLLVYYFFGNHRIGKSIKCVKSASVTKNSTLHGHHIIKSPTCQMYGRNIFRQMVWLKKPLFAVVIQTL